MKYYLKLDKSFQQIISINFKIKACFTKVFTKIKQKDEWNSTEKIKRKIREFNLSLLSLVLKISPDKVAHFNLYIHGVNINLIF